jgi:hypothetical protein
VSRPTIGREEPFPLPHDYMRCTSLSAAPSRDRLLARPLSLPASLFYVPVVAHHDCTLSLLWYYAPQAASSRKALTTQYGPSATGSLLFEVVSFFFSFFFAHDHGGLELTRGDG